MHGPENLCARDYLKFFPKKEFFVYFLCRLSPNAGPGEPRAGTRGCPCPAGKHGSGQARAPAKAPVLSGDVKAFNKLI